MFILFSVIITLVLSFIDRLTGVWDPALQTGLLSGVYALAVLIPTIAVGAGGCMISGGPAGGS